MDELIAQLTRIADALESQDRFNAEWMTFNQEIQAQQAKNQEWAEDTAKWHQDWLLSEQDRRRQETRTEQDRRLLEFGVVKQAIQERIAALDADEIKDIAQRVFTEVFPQGETEEANG